MELPREDSRIERLFPATLAGGRFVRDASLEMEVTGFFDELRVPLLRYLSTFGLASQDQEEVIQEVFLSLFLHLRAGKPRSNMRGWIFRVAHNLGLKCREKNQRTLKILANSGQHGVESHLDAAPDPEQHVSSLQRRQRLLAVVNALPEHDRQCLYLRAEGLRYREISQVLGMSLGGVAISLSRSLARLSRADGR
jgi:RNA polymerase sigma-70 factor (ECF subfamily)